MIPRLAFVPYMILGVTILATVAFAEDDPIYEQCMRQTDDPPPWCYQMEVERIGDADLCENILEYWPKADGVHGWCIYRLALKQKECSLCDRIQAEDVRKLCILDVCKPGK